MENTFISHTRKEILTGGTNKEPAVSNKKKGILSNKEAAVGNVNKTTTVNIRKLLSRHQQVIPPGKFYPLHRDCKKYDRKYLLNIFNVLHKVDEFKLGSASPMTRAHTSRLRYT